MYIRADINGGILLISVAENENCVSYTGAVPADFFAKVGLGKYQFINNEIVAVPAWTMPVITNPLTQAGN